MQATEPFLAPETKVEATSGCYINTNCKTNKPNKLQTFLSSFRQRSSSPKDDQNRNVHICENPLDALESQTNQMAMSGVNGHDGVCVCKGQNEKTQVQIIQSGYGRGRTKLERYLIALVLLLFCTCFIFIFMSVFLNRNSYPYSQGKFKYFGSFHFPLEPPRKNITSKRVKGPS